MVYWFSCRVRLVHLEVHGMDLEIAQVRCAVLDLLILLVLVLLHRFSCHFVISEEKDA
jgi:hypothetical protein